MAITISSNYYSGYAARRAQANSEWFSEWRANTKSSTGSVGSVTGNNPFDYKAAQKETAAMISQYKEQAAVNTALRKDAASFLTKYTAEMRTMDASASAVSGANLDKLVGEISAEGKISDANMKNTVDAVQTMVDAYNTNLETLNKNASRGDGVVKQIARMAESPAAESTMQTVGVTVNKDGSLKLDAEKLTTALSGAASADAKAGTSTQMKQIKDIIGGASGSIAAGVKSDARAGLAASANSLISNDLVKIQETSKNPFSNYFDAAYSRTGAFTNAGTMGLLMNVMA